MSTTEAKPDIAARGPVQDETESHHPLDALAMLAIERGASPAAAEYGHLLYDAPALQRGENIDGAPAAHPPVITLTELD